MNATTKRPARKVSRTLRLGTAVNGVRALLLTVGKKSCGYYVSRVPVDYGTGYRLEKFGVEEVEDEEEKVYHVHLDATLGDTCHCRGFLRHGHRNPCKHVAALRLLHDAGRI